MVSGKLLLDSGLPSKHKAGAELFQVDRVDMDALDPSLPEHSAMPRLDPDVAVPAEVQKRFQNGLRLLTRQVRCRGEGGEHAVGKLILKAWPVLRDGLCRLQPAVYARAQLQRVTAVRQHGQQAEPCPSPGREAKRQMPDAECEA